MLELAQSDQQIEDCFAVMAELRPHLRQDAFVAQIRRMQTQGYQLLYKKLADTVVAVAGFRIGENLFMGRHLYVDDLVTAGNARSCGYGAELLNALRQRAQQEGCRFLHLDSGTHRGQAHKFYFAQGLQIASYHFSETLE